jgi:hypothetical protein
MTNIQQHQFNKKFHEHFNLLLSKPQQNKNPTMQLVGDITG